MQLLPNSGYSLYEEIVMPTDVAYIFGDEVIELNYNL